MYTRSSYVTSNTMYIVCAYNYNVYKNVWVWKQYYMVFILDVRRDQWTLSMREQDSRAEPASVACGNGTP